mgnify:CR=1 FL=1
MDVSVETIQVIVQGGAVGILLVFGYGAYKIANRMIGFVSALVTNHLAELTVEIRQLREAVENYTSTRTREQ